VGDGRPLVVGQVGEQVTGFGHGLTPSAAAGKKDVEGILPPRPEQTQSTARMNIVGLGTQVMECARVRKLIDKHAEAFLLQVYTPREVRHCNGKAQSTEQFTAVWAAKEAVFRCLGTTWKRGTLWTDVEIVCENGGGPRVVVTGATADLVATRRVGDVLLTMAHCRAFATATAIAVGVQPARLSEDTQLDG
jgi:holo-[acyl-carrier protein] synthase